MWKSLSAGSKKTFEDSAAKAKEQRAAYIAKVKDTKEFKAYEDARAAARKQKLKRRVKSAVKAIAKDKGLKRAPSAYMSWLSDNRKTIKGKNVAEVSKKAGSMWKALSASSKKTYEDKAAKANEQRAAYIAKIKDSKEFKAYEEERAAARKQKVKRRVKSAVNAIKKDKNLKKPMSAYMSWFN